MRSPYFAMTMRAGRLASLTVALIATVAIPSDASQRRTSQPPTPPDFRGALDLVEVTVTVTDRDGNTVRDLTADDFEVSDDGDTQPLVTFGHVEVPREPFDAPVARPPSDVASNRQRRGEGRVYLLLLDDLHTNPLRTDTVRAIARDFVARHLLANDLVAVATTSGQPPRLPFTSNRRRLFEALDRFMGRDEAEPPGVGSTWNAAGTPGAPPGFTAPAPLRSIADFAERTYVDMEQEVARRAQVANARLMLRSLERFAEWMADLDARRKTIILVGQGIDYDTTVFGDLDAKTLPDEILRAAAAAARHDVTVYAIDPRGLPTGEPSSIRTRSLVGELPFSRDVVRAKQSLERIAEETGGVAFINSNQFGQAFERIVRENSAYYLLGYRPPRDTPDDKRHQIRVRVSRPDVVVRARRSYIDTRAGTAPTDPGDSATALATLLDSPLLRHGLQLDLSTVPFRNDETTEIVVAIQAGHPDPVGDRSGFGELVDVGVVATDADGFVLARRRAAVVLSTEERAASREHGLRAVLRLNVPPSERLYVRAAVIDRATGARGSVHHELAIPDLHAGPLAMSGLALGASRGGQPTTSADLRWTPRRVFTSDDTLELFAEVYLNGSDVPRTLDITCTIRGDDGAPWFRTQETRSPEETVTVYAESFPLWDLPPGRYVLALEVRDGDDALAVSRQVPFTVTRP